MKRHSWRPQPPVWPGSPADSPTGRPPELLIGDLADYLARIDCAEREWLVDQVACLGHDRLRVSVAISLAISNGQAREELHDGVRVIMPTSGRRTP